MEHSEPGILNGTAGYAALQEQYRAAVARAFPDLPEACPERWALPAHDALVLGALLDGSPPGVTILEMGNLTGAGALYFASQPTVREVVCAGESSRLADEVPGDPNSIPETLRDLRTLDVASTVLDEFPAERRKIKLPATGAETPEVTPPPGALVVAYIDRPQTREEARSRLKLVFEKAPGALAVLGGCRGAGGPYVQAGVVDFLEGCRDGLVFRLVGDLGPGLAASGLGLVFPEGSPVAKKALAALESAFTRRLDPLRLLSREEELVGIVNRFKDELEEERRQVADLEARNAKLSEGYAKVKENNAQLMEERSEQSRLAGTLERRLLRVPGVSRLLAERDGPSSATLAAEENPKAPPG